MLSFSVQEILECVKGRIVNLTELGGQLPEIQICRPASLGTSRLNEIAFFFSKAFAHELSSALPGVLITGEPFVPFLEQAHLPFWKQAAVIACHDPYLAMALISEKFVPHLSSVGHIPQEIRAHAAPQIHSSAVVGSFVELGDGVILGAQCVIESHSRIGAGTVLYPGCFIGSHSILGESCVLFPRVTLYEGTQLGNRVRLHSGAVIGSDGFGYAPKRENREIVGHQKIYHLGHVILGDDVEIGANSCVDRGTLGNTRIEKQVKLDNLVHIGHNSHLAEGAVICGGTCLAGNASVGKYAYVGGLTGIGNQVHVGDGATVGALTMVTKDIPPRGTAVGNPQRNDKEHFRAHALLNRLLAERRSK